MTCREFILFLDDYVDMKVDANQKQRFEEHLDECPDCVAFLDSYRTTYALSRKVFSLAAQPLPPAPPQLVEAILKARASEQR